MRPGNRVWSIGLLSAGLLLVGAMYGLKLYSVPDRPVAKAWYVYLPLLGPYVLGAIGIATTRSIAEIRIVVRVLSLLICGAGCVLLWFAFDDARPVLDGGRPPDIPQSALVGVILLIAQYGAAIGALFMGLVSRLAR